jgi:uncharacterized membrane protein required for colicin V production
MYAIIIDVALVGIIALFALLGFKKGFFKTVIGFVGTIAALAISIYLATYMCQLLMPVFKGIFGEGGAVASKLTDWLNGVSPLFQGADLTQLGTALATDLKLPGPIADVIVNAVGKLDFSASGLTLSQIVAQALTGWIYWLAMSILLFIILKIGLFFVGRLLNGLTKIKAVGMANKVLGLILGVAKGAVIIVVIFGIMSFVIGLSFMADFNTHLQNTMLAKPLSDLVFEFVGNNIHMEDILQKVFGDKKPAIGAALSAKI